MGLAETGSRATTRRRASYGLAAFVACAALGADATGQTVRGTVIGDGQPVPGVLLTLLDSAARIAARTLTNADGRYALPAPAAGRYRIYTLRIGFRPTTSDWFDLADTTTVERRIILAGIPVALDAVRVVGQTECRVAGDSSASTFAIWEQARAALIAARVSTQQPLTATKVFYERTLEPSSSRARVEAYSVATSVVSDPWRAPAADVLEQLGFVTTDEKGYTTYSAPDLDVLLSDRFTIDHCFRLAQSSDSTRIGLAFEPTAERRRARGVADVQGTIWLDRSSSELRQMEFGYTNLPRAAQTAGGDIRFTRLRDGSWVIGAWSLRMPVLATDLRTSNYGSMLADPNVRVSAVQIVGGALVAATRGADTVFAQPRSAVKGQVRDSVTRSPVIGARVHVAGTALEAVTDASGRFVANGLLPGTYELEVHTPSLDSLGAVSRIEFEFADTSKTLDVRVPNASHVASRLCTATTAKPARGLVMGTVSLPHDAAWTFADKDISVIARWRDASVTDRVHELTAKTDANGGYRLCGIPLDVPVAISTSLDRKRGAGTDIRVSSSVRFARLNLTATDHPTTRLIGIVRADSGGVAIANADVSLSDVGRSTRSDAQGRFHLDSIELGVHRLTVRQIGFEMVDTSIALDGLDSGEREVHLSRSVVLDSVRVTAESRDVRMREFEDNRRLGLGHFFTRADIAKKDGLTLLSVLADMTGSRVVTGTHGAALATTRGRATSIGNQIVDLGPDNKPDCYSTVYVDNVAVFRAAHGDPYFNLNTMQPDEIEAIEYYAGPSELPARYNQLNSSCGVLVIHRRR